VDIRSNQSLWRLLAQQRWPDLFSTQQPWSGVEHWHRAYMAGHRAAQQVRSSAVLHNLQLHIPCSVAMQASTVLVWGGACMFATSLPTAHSTQANTVPSPASAPSCTCFVPLQLATQQPWTASINSTYKDTPRLTGQLLLAEPCLFTAAAADASTGNAVTCDTARSWQAQTCAVAAVAGRLQFWCWHNADPPFPQIRAQQSSVPPLAPASPTAAAAAEAAEAEHDTPSGPINPAGVDFAVRSAAASAAGAACHTCHSHESYGHTGAVTAILQVPIGTEQGHSSSGCRLG
jgi:hypothetical protein